MTPVEWALVALLVGIGIAELAKFFGPGGPGNGGMS